MAEAYAGKVLTNTHLVRDLEDQQDTEPAKELGFNRVFLESAIEKARRGAINCLFVL